MRLRTVAGEWFPTLPVDVLDRIVAAAWIEGRDANGGSGERTAVVAAAAVRRLGLRALRGDAIEIPEGAEARIAALTSNEPAPDGEGAQRFRRRARPEALGRRAPGAPAVVDEPTEASGPTVRPSKRDDVAEDDRPPTRRRRGNRNEERQAADARAATEADSERGLRSLRILAETVQIITGRRGDDDKEIVEIPAQEAPAKAPTPAKAPKPGKAPKPAKALKPEPAGDAARPATERAPAAKPAPPPTPTRQPKPEAQAADPARPPAAPTARVKRPADPARPPAAPTARVKRPAAQPPTVDPVPTATATATTVAAPAAVPVGAAAPAETVGPVRASAARPATATPARPRAAARRPVTTRRRPQSAGLRRALPFAALAAVTVVAIAVLSSVFGDSQGGTRVAQVRAPRGASDIAQVVQTTAAKTQAARVAAEREVRAKLAAQQRRAAARRHAVAARHQAAARRRAAAKRRAAAERRAAAKRRAAARRTLPPAASVPAAQPTPQPPVYRAPSSGGSSGGGGAWGGEFGP